MKGEKGLPGPAGPRVCILSQLTVSIMSKNQKKI